MGIMFFEMDFGEAQEGEREHFVYYSMVRTEVGLVSLLKPVLL